MLAFMENFSVYSTRIIPLAFVSVLLYASCNETQKDEASSTPVRDSSGYQLVWSDEFNKSFVDTANWVYDIGGEGWGNHEQEYYQADNATVENGELIITGKKEDKSTNHYTSSRMKTKGKHEFLYGKIEARIKIPVGQGLWPAFWMLGANIDEVDWPSCGEIDIMEHINADSLIFGTPHWNNNGHVMKGDTIASTPSDYHIYEIEWDSAALRWYVDGKQFHELNIKDNFDSTEEFHRPQFILLNLAIGGDWPGQKIDESKIPAKMYVDYVRVYQKE
jgi:beta-glucanase (GH16 family)